MELNKLNYFMCAAQSQAQRGSFYLFTISFGRFTVELIQML